MNRTSPAIGVAILLPLMLLTSTNAAITTEIITADVHVHSPAGQWASLEPGQLISDWNRYYWHEVPEFAQEQEMLFWQYEHTGYPTPADGITTFEVLASGAVLMAVTTRWGGGGNSSGGWVPELTTREELEADGWFEIAGGLSSAQVGYTYPEGGTEYVVFRRACVAGEVFTYRTEKYRPPQIIRSTTVVPEPSTALAWSGLAMMGLIFSVARRRRTIS